MEHTRPTSEKYKVTRIGYNDIYDRYITIAESNFGNRIQWWQISRPSYELGDAFSIKYDWDDD